MSRTSYVRYSGGHVDSLGVDRMIKALEPDSGAKRWGVRGPSRVSGVIPKMRDSRRYIYELSTGTDYKQSCQMRVGCPLQAVAEESTVHW